MPAFLGGITTLIMNAKSRPMIITLEMPAFLGGIATNDACLVTTITSISVPPSLEMPAFLGGIATQPILLLPMQLNALAKHL